MRNIDLINQVIQSPRDSKLRLIYKINDGTGFFSFNGLLHYLVKDDGCSRAEIIETEFITLVASAHISSLDSGNEFRDGYYNVIRYNLNTINNNLDTLIMLCETYSLNYSNLNFKKFFYSMVELFQLSNEQNSRNIIGLMGELHFLLDVFHNSGICFADEWHTESSSSKFDVVRGGTCIEIKTTTNPELVIDIKHDQLFSQANVILCVVQLERNNSGESLENLLSKINSIQDYSKNINFQLNLSKELTRITPKDKVEKKYSRENMVYFISDEINEFRDVPGNVSKLEYKLDLTDKDQISYEEVVIKIDQGVV